jgi:hypothetical protein
MSLAQREFSNFTPTLLLDRLPRSSADKSYKVLLNLAGPRTFGPPDPGQQALKDEIRKLTVGVAKYSLVHRIPADKVDESIREEDVDYYKVDSGMNINVPQGRIKEIRFSFDIYADGSQSGGAFAIDGFPNDKIKRVTIISGQIQISINKLLQLIPYPEAQKVLGAVDIELNPWKIDWGYNKLEVGFSEGLTDKLDWYLSADNVNQSFQCYFTLKKKKSVRQVKGIATASWTYEPAAKGARDWLKKNLGRQDTTVGASDTKEKSIIR